MDEIIPDFFVFFDRDSVMFLIDLVDKPCFPFNSMVCISGLDLAQILPILGFV